jgi:hypothetical protein
VLEIIAAFIGFIKRTICGNGIFKSLPLTASLPLNYPSAWSMARANPGREGHDNDVLLS